MRVPTNAMSAFAKSHVMRINSFYCDGLLSEGSRSQDLDSDEEEGEVVNVVHVADDWLKVYTILDKITHK
jgi:hypothetical protein